jgi:hypothetical protein
MWCGADGRALLLSSLRENSHRRRAATPAAALTRNNCGIIRKSYPFIKNSPPPPLKPLTLASFQIRIFIRPFMI